MEDNKPKRLYNWQQFDEDAQKIAEWAKDKNFKNIYAIPTGGLTLGVVLHNLLKIPLLLHEEDISKETLIVDDIMHSGGRIERLFRARGLGYKVAVLFLNTEEAKIKPDYFVNGTKVWILFPWETEESSRYDGTI